MGLDPHVTVPPAPCHWCPTCSRHLCSPLGMLGTRGFYFKAIKDIIMRPEKSLPGHGG